MYVILNAWLSYSLRLSILHFFFKFDNNFVLSHFFIHKLLIYIFRKNNSNMKQFLTKLSFNFVSFKLVKMKNC